MYRAECGDGTRAAFHDQPTSNRLELLPHPTWQDTSLILYSVMTTCLFSQSHACHNFEMDKDLL